MSSLVKRIELIANVAIIVVAILLGTVLVRSYLLSRAPTQPPTSQPSVSPGTHLSVPGVNWQTNKRTLIMALSTQCHFCTESSPFYKQLSQQRGADVRLLAVLPQPVSESEAYLKELGFNADEVRQASLAAINVSATP